MIELYEAVGEKKVIKKVIESGSEAAPQKSLTKKRRRSKEKESFINKKVSKVFEDGIIYSGVVTSYDGEYWLIEYDDGDKEDFDQKELQAGILLYKQQKKT
jgi:hypothetical protein